MALRWANAFLYGGVLLALSGCNTTSEKPTAQMTDQARLMKLAADVERRGDSGTALALYERAATSSADPVIQLRLAKAREAVDDLEGAETVYRTVLVANPNNAEALAGLGSIQLQSGDAQGAVRSLTAAAGQAPSGRIYNKLGTAYILLGQTENAETAFSKALNIEPGKLDTRTNLALAQAIGGKFPMATTTMREVVASPLVERRQLINYAVILRMSGRADDARAVHVPEMTAAGKETILRQAANAISIKDPASRAKAIGMIASG
ncbi:tetratricopeptide repeat protein [Phyllobacterium myrsinacearum]|uniref:Flp pilus assembly protein TadD n=1 Tax=Phyllobacterium myrsinacearum TaxID=28101 RepID=A0A839ET12_9HYPH|nr:tetratricopeptide repeat protein [Phyllobacterium myrsinacearum]MBA8879567.1 Flp pilus assembly protein TadD [Phyllobacterium myrsinacearum]